MDRFRTSQWSIITKLSIMSILIIFAVGGIVAVNLFVFRNVEGLLITMLDRDVAQVIRNARLGREFSGIFAETNVLINTFTERGETVKIDGDRLVLSLQRNISALTPEGGNLQSALKEFRQELQSLLDQCVVVNDMLDTLQVIERNLNSELETLDNIVVEKSLAIAIEGTREEASAIEQLSNMLSGYREILYQVTIQFTRSKQAHLGIRTVKEDYEQEILLLLEELHTGLGATTTAWEDINPPIKQSMETVLQYKKHITTLHTDMREFQTRLNTLENAQKRVMSIMGEIDEQIARKTRNIRGNIADNIQASVNTTMILSGVIFIVLIIVEIYTVRMIQPIKQLANIAEQLSEGDINCNIQGLRRSASFDEIGTLSGAFKKLITYNQEMASIATAISQGNLSRNIRSRSERDVFGHAFLNMSVYLNDLAVAATAIAAGDLDQDIQPKTKLDVLGNAFQMMALQLHENFETIETQLGKIQQASEERERLLDDLQENNETLQIEITERKRAEEAAEAANRAKTEFLANISHELRTPLTVILGMAQIMSRSPDVPQKQREYLESILRSGNHLLLLVNRLIEASKLEAKRPFSSEHKFDLVHLLDEVHAIERQQVEGRVESDQDGEQNILTSAALADLPEELRVSLQEAVERADFEMTINVIDQIRQHNTPLADALAELVKGYRFDTLQALFEETEQ